MLVTSANHMFDDVFPDIVIVSLLYHDPTAPSEPGSPHYRSFLITLGHTTLVRVPLEERAARRSYLYLTTHNTHNKHTSMPPVVFEPTIPAGDRPQNYALDRAATGTGSLLYLWS
jgi:hypothetical protein